MKIVDTVPPPGSDAAIMRGCSCSTTFNHEGAGAYWVNGKPVHWVEGGCVLHDPGGKPDCRLKAISRE